MEVSASYWWQPVKMPTVCQLLSAECKFLHVMRRAWPRRPQRWPPWCRHNKCTERTSASRLQHSFVFYSSVAGDASATPVSCILSSQRPALSSLLAHSLLVFFLFHPPCAHFTPAVPPFNFSPSLSSSSPPSPHVLQFTLLSVFLPHPLVTHPPPPFLLCVAIRQSSVHFSVFLVISLFVNSTHPYSWLNNLSCPFSRSLTPISPVQLKFMLFCLALPSSSPPSSIATCYRSAPLAALTL